MSISLLMKFYGLMFYLFIVVLIVSCRKQSYTPSYFYKNTKVIALCNAITDGNKRGIDTLLKKQGVNINAIGRDGMTPLLWALKGKNKQIYELILKRGGDPNIKIKSGRLKNKSVMFLVCLMDDSSYLETTLKYIKRVNNPTISCNALSNTISNSKTSLAKVKMLIAAGAKINQKNSMGDPPIITAGIINQWHIVYYLLRAGADPMLTSNDGMSLIYLIEKSNELMSRKGFRYQYLLKCAKFLRGKGIEVDVSKPQKYPEKGL